MVKRSRKQIKGIIDRMMDRTELAYTDRHGQKKDYLVSHFAEWGVFFGWDHVFDSLYLGEENYVELEDSYLGEFDEENFKWKYGGSSITNHIRSQIMRIIPDEFQVWACPSKNMPVVFKPKNSHFHVVAAPVSDP